MNRSGQSTVNIVQYVTLRKIALIRNSVENKSVIPKANYLKTINFFCFLILVQSKIKFIAVHMKQRRAN